jgi:hypothetical protein
MFKKITIIVAIIIGIAASLYLASPPKQPGELDLDYLSFKNMQDHLNYIAQEPHPSGSKELEVVSDYIIKYIQSCGIEPVIEEKTFTTLEVAAESLKIRQKLAAPDAEINSQTPQDLEEEIKSQVSFTEDGTLTIKNIFAKLDAPGTDRAVLFVSHYDTVSQTPGASDDSVSVSAMLEALKSYSEKTDLANDLYFLFTDGGEAALLGSKAFVDTHPELLTKVGVVLNFEARGNKGKILMFETSDKNAALIEHYQKAVSNPLSYSLMPTIYRTLNIDTDLSNFLEAGYNGMNFAANQGVDFYHKSTDTPENLNTDTAYNYLSNVLDLADYFSVTKVDPILDNPAKENSVYISMYNYMLIFNKNINLIASIAAFALGLLWLIFERASKKIKLFKIILYTLMFAFGVALTGAMGYGVQLLLTQWFKISPDNNFAYGFYLIILYCSVVFMIYTVIMYRESPNQVIANVLFVNMILLGVVTYYFEDLSYLFVLTTAVTLLVGLVCFNRVLTFIMSFVSTIAMVVLHTSLIKLLYDGLLMGNYILICGAATIITFVCASYFSASCTTYQKKYIPKEMKY